MKGSSKKTSGLPQQFFYNRNKVQNFVEKHENTEQKLPKHSKKLRNTGQKSRKYHLCMKNENIQNMKVSHWKMTKNINVYIDVGYIMVVISNCVRYALLGT